VGARRQGGAEYKLNAADPLLESAWFQPSSLRSENLVSEFAFSQIQLVPLYVKGFMRWIQVVNFNVDLMMPFCNAVGLCKLNPADPQLESAW
jgi:hypothetical protein